jgi:serine phosphatase RsbU (regulator of sigma subunit)
VWNGDFGTQQWAIRFLLTAALGGAAIVSARLRLRRERDLRDMTAIAETAQRALLRSLPTAAGSFGLAARYISATRAAQVGGDLYEVVETPHGLRVIIGDVRGKGLEAVQMAATVLAAFRQAAYLRPSLDEVAAELDRVVSDVAGDEDFVTALLADFAADETVSVVNCGHHPPILVRSGQVETVGTGEPQLPLGLGTRPRTVTSPWPAGSRLLFYTDGLVETRDQHGTFFPLDRGARVLAAGTLAEALDRLLELLRDFAGGRLDDDIALLIAERMPEGSAPAPPAAPA